jgi:hypothetical protein
MLRMGVSIGCGNRSDAGIVSSTLGATFTIQIRMQWNFQSQQGYDL